MGQVIDTNGNEAATSVISGNDDLMREDVCEHCLGGIFKLSGSVGECHIGPPQCGVFPMPRPNQLTGQMEVILQPWSKFPDVERRHFCMAFEPATGEVDG